MAVALPREKLDRIPGTAVDNGVQAQPGHASVSVVIPTKNEAENIVWVLQRIPSVVDEVVLVDGLSTDGTVEVAQMVYPDVVVVREKRPGKGAAVRAGFEAATGDFIVMLDADGSMDPMDICLFLAFLSSGFDFVKGSRFAVGGGTADMTQLRRAGNGALRRLTNALYRMRFSDLCYGYVGFHRRVLPDIMPSADGFEIEMQLIARAVRARLRIAEIPSYESRRMNGVSNLRTFRDGWRVFRTLTRERFERRAYRISDAGQAVEVAEALDRVTLERGEELSPG